MSTVMTRCEFGACEWGQTDSYRVRDAQDRNALEAGTAMSLATPTILVCCAIALCLGISGCAATPFGAGVRPLAALAQETQPECASDSGTIANAGADHDASPEPSRFQRLASGALRKTETFARGTLGAIGGAAIGALGGAGAGLIGAGLLGAQGGGCIHPSTCGSLVAGMAALGAIVGGTMGAVNGMRYALSDSDRRHGSAELCGQEKGTELRAHPRSKTIDREKATRNSSWFQHGFGWIACETCEGG